MQNQLRRALALFSSAVLITSGFAAPVTFTKLTGLTGGSIQGTAVYRADLSGVGFTNLFSVTIADNSFSLGGSPGQFSGFDLDAIKLSYTSVGTASDASILAGLPVFDFTTSSTFFTPGTQRPVADPKLFGTGVGGSTVDNAIATLGSFDGENTIVTPFGFISMGDGGILSFNLSSPISTAGLFLYIGEVGDNGEVAAGAVTVRDTPVQGAVPEPSTYGLMGAALLVGIVAIRRRALRA